ncbi:MAG: OmpA family protein [Variovorax sp.]|nr:OmpA family protein [Variovorax sp.]
MSRRQLAPLLANLAIALVLSACSTSGTRVILLPQPDGRPSAVVVSTEDGQETLSEPYQRATAKARERGAPVVDKADPARVEAENKPLFELMPPSPQRFTVYFDVGETLLTPASQRIVNDALAAAQARSGGEIVVTGHTDTVGPLARNDGLSRERAAIVRQIFLDRGFAANRVEAVGRGEREPAIPTADEVAEPRNRRVTIEVR